MIASVDCEGQQFTPNVIVSKAGNGNYTTITEAVRGIPNTANGRYVIHIKSGVYRENIVISRPDVTLVGDGMDRTIISSSRNQDDGASILNSGAVTVTADNFIGTYISFQNASGPQKHQAVALRIQGDKSAFYRCGFVGYQDTLYVHGGRQFFRECTIYGTIDFIFGDAAVVLQKCTIKLRRPLRGQENVITAQGRNDISKNTGISIHDCTITTNGSFQSGSVKCYLGRPWKKYSRVIAMKSYIDKAIDPSGWLDMNGNHDTVEYREYGNYGYGASTRNRVRWRGYKVLKTANEAKPYTVAMFINGNQWLPSTGIPFMPEL